MSGKNWKNGNRKLLLGYKGKQSDYFLHDRKISGIINGKFPPKGAKTMRPEFIPVGRIVNAHGIRGEVKLNPEGCDPGFLTAFDTLYIAGEPVRVLSSRVHKSVVLLTLPGVTDMDAALALKGKVVSIRREDARLPEGEYFDEELVGLTVFDDASGEELGRVDRVLTYPAHKIYQVKGAREYLIPAVPGVFIASVDPDAGVMRVHLMKGLATDEN